MNQPPRKQSSPRNSTVHWTTPDGLTHRDTDPTIEFPEGQREWWINGSLINGSLQRVLDRAYNRTLTDADALNLLNFHTDLHNSTSAMVVRLIAQNPSPFLSNRVRGLAALTR